MKESAEKKQNFWDGFKRAFAIEKKGEYHFTDYDYELMDKIARKIVKLGLVIPAVIALESVKPLNYIGSQTLVFFRPIVDSILSCDEYDHFSKLLEHRNSIEELIIRIERENDEPEKKQRD